MATIHFPQSIPVYTINTTIAFLAIIDDAEITAEISEEALMDNFGASNHSSASLLEAFKNHRHAIEAVARLKLPGRIAAGKPLLVSTDF
jgi:hypothetical protein